LHRGEEVLRQQLQEVWEEGVLEGRRMERVIVRKGKEGRT
jgi:hypothetical protein